jgi:quercetin dioxygenase-like cupin family protein
MRIVDLAAIPNRTVDRFASRAARHARIADIASGSAVGVIHLGPDGRLGRHPAAVPQLMVVTGGSGYASGDDAKTVRLSTGDAVVWARGEDHETWTEDGIVLLIIETDDPNLGISHG